MFKNMKIQMKLILAFGTILAIVLFLSFLAYTFSIKIGASAQLVKGETIIFSGYAQGMKQDIIQVQQWISDISATRALDGLNDGIDEADNSRKAFLEKTAQFKKMFEEKNDQKEG